MVFIFAVKNVGIRQGTNMIGGNKLEPEQMVLFKEMVDECVLDNVGNEKMRQGFEAIDEWAREQEMDFYELMINLFSPEELKFMIAEYSKEKEEAKDE